MKLTTAQIDLLWVLALLLVYVMLAIHFEFSEHLEKFSHIYEPFQLDEMPWALLFLSMGLAWYSWRRSTEAQLEIQERIRSEQQIQELLTHNSDLAQRLFTAQEDERRALARELHDEMGQSCTAIRTEAAVLAGGRLSPNEVLDSSQRIAYSAQEIALLTRNMLQRLRPAVLDSMGVTEALMSHCEQWQKSTGTVCHFKADPITVALSDYVGVTLYRLLQEGLTNIAKHAHAQRVEVSLSCDAQTLSLRIQDNGRGMFNPQSNHEGFGLLGMRERVASLGGQLHLFSQPGKGFTVEAKLPLESI